MKKILTCILSLTILLVLLDASASALCVNVSEANLRYGPGTRHEKTWKVFKYMPFRKLYKEGNWYKVKDVDGDVHWVYKNLVTDKYKCAAVKTKTVNIRSGPGTKYKKLTSPAEKYTSFKVIDTKGSWVKVQDEYGDTGWIFKDLLWIQ